MGKKPDYSIDGLRNGIEDAKRSKAYLQKAMDDEDQKIATYKIMIDDLQRAKREHAEAARLSRTIEVARE